MRVVGSGDHPTLKTYQCIDCEEVARAINGDTSYFEWLMSRPKLRVLPQAAAGGPGAGLARYKRTHAKEALFESRGRSDRQVQSSIASAVSRDSM
jgi:hypothetical protein